MYPLHVEGKIEINIYPPACYFHLQDVEAFCIRPHRIPVTGIGEYLVELHLYNLSYGFRDEGSRFGINLPNEEKCDQQTLIEMETISQQENIHYVQ